LIAVINQKITFQVNKKIMKVVAACSCFFYTWIPPTLVIFA